MFQLADTYNHRGGDRIGWIDFLRGICLIAIVVGHMGVPELKRYVYVFHLPVFFILAGFFFGSSETLGAKPFLKKKLSQLIVPYYVSCIPLIALYPALEYYHGGG